MTTIARTAEEEQRRAWADYVDRLRGLSGAEYERAEQEAWDALQRALSTLPGEPGSSRRALG